MAKLIRHCTRCDATIEQNDYEPNTPAEPVLAVSFRGMDKDGQFDGVDKRVLCEDCYHKICHAWIEFRDFVERGGRDGGL